MNPRLIKRPLLVAVLGAALIAGGTVSATPAVAAPVPSPGKSADGPGVPGPPTDEPTTPAPIPSESEDPGTQSTAEGTGVQSKAEPADVQSDDPEPDPADTTPPTGSFKLNLGSLWVGQRTSLTQVNVADNGVADPAAVTRLVSWGDGTSSRLTAGQAPLAKQYTRAGKFAVTLTLTDAAGNSSTTSSTVTVTVPGKFALSRSIVWPGQVFSVRFSSVPAGTTRITLDWGDGYLSTHKGVNQAVEGLFFRHKNGALIRGKVTMRATFTNKNGNSSWITVGQVTVRTDSWAPVVKVTKPAKSNRASSWKTVRGGVSDKGSGAPYVYVWVTRVTGDKLYCFTPKKKWTRIYSEAQFDSTCHGVEVKASKGKWSMKLGGVKKGILYVDVRTWDWGNNASKWASLKVKITR